MTQTVNILISWPYLDSSQNSIRIWGETLTQNKGQMRLLLDSGAFTNWKAGKEGSVEEYVAFIQRLPFEPWRYFTLDRIGDSVATEVNYQTMLDQGMTPVPIFTRGTSIDQLEAMYTHSDLVGLGVGVGSKGYLSYVRWVMEQNKRPMHWLGVGHPGLIRWFHPYSCDTSSWEAGGRYGIIPVYKGQGEFQMWSRAKAAKGPPSRELWEVIESYGVNPRDLEHEQNWRGSFAIARRLGGQSWLRYAAEVEELTGTLVFLVVTTTKSLRCLLDAWEYNELYADKPIPVAR